jgi:hypothetical protein
VRWLLLALLLSCGGRGQTRACAMYLQCSEAIEPGSLARLEGSFGPNGRCWENDTVARECDASCLNGWVTLSNANPMTQACY